MSGRGRRLLSRLAREAGSPVRSRGRIDGLGSDLARALDRGALALAFQPIVSLRAARCERVEALLRWTHPVHGPIDPRDLVAAASESGLLLPLARWVVRASALERQAWAESGLALGLSVNLEGPELERGGADALLATAESERIPTGALTFDVRARAAVDPAVRDGMRTLVAGGARLALDDVTTADAPSRRSTTDVDELKLARALVRRAVADHASRVALRGLLALGRDTGLVSVAVGVEDEPTWRLLASLGCDLAQGVWASRPLVTAEVAPWHGWVARLALTGTAALATTSALARGGIAAERAPIARPTALPSPATGCCTVRAEPSTAPTIDLETRTYDSGGVRVVVDASVDEAMARTVVATAGADRRAVEAMLGVPLARTPTVYVIGSRDSFARVLERSFGQSALAAAALASAHGGVAFPDRASVVLNRENLGSGPLTIVRHELTHLLVHQLAGDADLPAWLDEGLATLAERDASGDPIAELRDAARTSALLSRGVITLTALGSPEGWLADAGGADGGSYTVSVEAVRMLRDRLGDGGLSRLLLDARTDGFTDAFGASVGMSPADFERAFSADEARAHSGLRLATRTDGEPTRWAVAGVTPGTTVHITIDGDGYHVAFDVALGPDGVYEAVFGGTAPRGSYTLTASHGGATVTTELEVR